MLINTLAAMTLGLVLNMMAGKPKLFQGFENLIILTAERMEKFLKKHYQDTPKAQEMAGSAMVFFHVVAVRRNSAYFNYYFLYIYPCNRYNI